MSISCTLTSPCDRWILDRWAFAAHPTLHLSGAYCNPKYSSILHFSNPDLQYYQTQFIKTKAQRKLFDSMNTFARHPYVVEIITTTSIK